jgi:hypothetical protein
MKHGRSLGQSGRFTQLAPVIRRSFDIASMARLSVGPSWAGLTEVQPDMTSLASASLRTSEKGSSVIFERWINLWVSKVTGFPEPEIVA